MVAASIANWQNTDYRKKVIDALRSPEVVEKLAIARAAQSGHISSIQNMLYTYLDELGIEYHKESNKTRIGYYVFDCLVVNCGKKILIECQGDYWHSLSKNERNDRSKFTYISRYFPEYEIMYIWEHEFYCKDRVLDRLKLKLGIGIETKEFKFSELTLQQISYDEVKQFLDLYHYLSKDRGGKAIGAYFGDLLVAVVVFSPPLRQNTAGQFGLIDGEVRELSRLCIHPSYHKKNFASWFIKRALKQIECKLVVAYADTTVGHTGGIYKASNFKLHHTVPADYWYVDKEGYVMHKRTLYGKAKNLKITEKEFAKIKGYRKIYGGEKLCFVSWRCI
jgi:GNAT superfamily N-acetyltransferase